MMLTVGDARLDGDQAALQDDLTRAVRRARLPAVRPRADAGGAEVRRRLADRGGRAGAGGRGPGHPASSAWRPSRSRATACWCIRAGELTGTRLVWVDRSGKETPVLDAPADYRDTSLSPDGTRLAYDISDGGNTAAISGFAIWRAASRRVSRSTRPAEINPHWSPDGRRIVYTSRAKGPGDLFVKDASGTKEAEPLLVDQDEKYVSDWSRDGRYILYTSRGTRRPRLGHLGAAHRRRQEAFPIGNTQVQRDVGRPSRPMASTSRISPTSRAGRRSTSTSSPRRGTNGRSRPKAGPAALARRRPRAVLSRGDQRVMAVPVQAGAAFSVGTPVRLFDTRFAAVTVRGHYRADAGRPALPRARAARARHGAAGRGRAELVVSTEELRRQTHVDVTTNPPRRAQTRRRSRSLAPSGAGGRVRAAAWKKIPIGTQLWCVRKQLATDIPGTLNALGALGYEAVELENAFGKSGAEWRTLPRRRQAEGVWLPPSPQRAARRQAGRQRRVQPGHREPQPDHPLAGAARVHLGRSAEENRRRDQRGRREVEGAPDARRVPQPHDGLQSHRRRVLVESVRGSDRRKTSCCSSTPATHRRWKA